MICQKYIRMLAFLATYFQWKKGPGLIFSIYNVFRNVHEFNISWQKRQSNLPFGWSQKFIISELQYEMFMVKDKIVTLKDKCPTLSVFYCYHCLLW